MKMKDGIRITITQVLSICGRRSVVFNSDTLIFVNEHQLGNASAEVKAA